ncbi:LppA family lipoprotein [Nocardia arizonensis]|uniref:LppA family lipoprotein n=1 Tax=Nocardia arizonensis TaxID=1141647 RepID=UPI0006CFC36B|nr:LppA family lipoprotein [Nocardia arizonensis]
MTKKTRAILAAVAVVAVSPLAVLLTIVGVYVLSDNSNEPTGAAETARAAEVLRARPTMETSIEQVRSVVEQIAAAGSRIDTRLVFDYVGYSSSPDCAAPFDRTRGRNHILRNYYADVPVPEASWNEFLERARVLAATVGATEVRVMANAPAEGDRPATHDVWFTGEDGVIIKVASKRATVITGSTGCRLDSADFGSPIR